MTGSLKSAHGALKRAMLFKFDWKCLAPARQEAGVSRRLAHIDFLLPGLIVTAAAVAVVAPRRHLARHPQEHVVRLETFIFKTSRW